jgi:hypothetical protein
MEFNNEGTHTDPSTGQFRKIYKDSFKNEGTHTD